MRANQKAFLTTAGLVLKRAPAGVIWVYVDGSAGRGGYGWAATVYFPSGTTLVFCLPCPF